MKRNTTIDLAKYIGSLLIIGIHTNLCADLNETVGFVIVDIICRLAVPFFVVSTGYFLVAQSDEDQRENITQLRRQGAKLIKLYFIWTILYLIFSIPLWIRNDWFSPWAFVDYAIGSVKNGSYYHLWYILSLIYAMPIIYILLPALKRNYLIPISVGLYAIMLLFYSYNWCLPERCVSLVNWLSYSFPLTAGVFLMVPLLLLGIRIRIGSILPIKMVIVGLAISFCGLCAESFWLRGNGHTKVSYIIFSYLTAFFLFQLLLNIPTDRKLFTKLARISVFVYCVHPMLIEILRNYVKSSITLYLGTALLSSLIGVGCVAIRRQWVNTE